MTAIEVKNSSITEESVDTKFKEKTSNSRLKGEKTKKKKRKRDEADSNNLHISKKTEEHGSVNDEKSSNMKRKLRRKEKETLLQKVPEKDENGISYTKLQRRRMMKRVKRGLQPVPTPEEEVERVRNETLLKEEEEAELAGMVYDRNKQKVESSDDEEEDDGEVEAVKEFEKKKVENNYVLYQENDMPEKQKRKRSKPVPLDYICQACKNKNQPIHWIYDCPDKVTKKTKQIRGLHQPDEKKLFVSGLPFNVKRKDIELLFNEVINKHGKLVHCKLITFPDTGRCKGQAYLTFDSIKSAKNALKLNGTIISSKANNNGEKKNELSQSSNRRKELRLKVTRMLNRKATKGGSRFLLEK